MRLTTDLIGSALSYLNPLKERELDLRGHRITAIENLGVAGPHDAIDFTDNDIQVLGNFPLSPRLTTLLLAQNHISAIQPMVTRNIPNLRHLALSSNRLAELIDLHALGSFRSLTHLDLSNNPVTRLENYRHWVIWRCPSVRFLDYQKVKDIERARAKELFGTAEIPTTLTTKIMGVKSRIFDSINLNGSPAAPAATIKRIKLTDTEKAKLKELISQATSLQEISRLEKELNEGRLPAGLLDGSEAMEE